MVQLDHVAIRTTEFEKTKAFFEDVFGMRSYSSKGEAPNRIIFYLEGLQLNEVEKLPYGDNSFDHLAIGVDSVAAVMQKVRESYPECGLEKDHWIVLPDRETRIELKPFGHAFRAAGETLEKLRTIPVSELCGNCTLPHTMDPEIRPVGSAARFVGTAVTVDLPEGDAGILREAISAVGQGEVLVVAGHGSRKVSLFGREESCLLAERGAAGAVIDGSVRDASLFGDRVLPVFARGTCAVPAKTSAAGEINVPVSCGGQVVLPGDVICADENGILVLRGEDANRA